MIRRAETYVGRPCRRCGSEERYKVSRHCVDCVDIYRRKSAEWHSANRIAHNAVMRAAQLKRKFGLAVEEYDEMLRDQNGGCAICQKPCLTGRSLAVDHCHTTNKIRGLLCHNCNVGMGKLKDDPALLMAAASYLLKNAAIDDDEEKRATSDASQPPKSPTISMVPTCT